MSDQEFETFVTDEKNERFFLKIPQNEEKKEYIQRVARMTGKLPREVGFFKNMFAQDFSKYKEAAIRQYTDRAVKVYKGLDSKEQDRFIGALSEMFDLDLPVPANLGSGIYDQGIVFMTSPLKALPVNEPAREVLLEMLVNNTK